MDGCDDDRDKNGDRCRSQEVVPLDLDMPAEVLKPFEDRYIGDGPADHIGYQYEPDKFSGKNGIYLCYSGTVNPSNTDLLCFFSTIKEVSPTIPRQAITIARMVRMMESFEKLLSSL